MATEVVCAIERNYGFTISGELAGRPAGAVSLPISNTNGVVPEGDYRRIIRVSVNGC